MNDQELTQYANELANNPLLQEIFNEIETSLTDRLKEANLANEKELMALTLGLQIKEQIVDFIQECTENEKVVQYNQKKQKQSFFH